MLFLRMKRESNNFLLVLYGVFALVLLAYPAFAVTDISACQDLSVVGEYYNLTQNVNSSGTCFNITANNITLDGNGYTVNYSQSVTGYGVNITGKNNITIKNLNIVQQNSSVSNAYTIYGSGMTNSTITNNTIATASSYSVFLDSSNTNLISNNVITTTSSLSSIMLQTSSTNTISNNNITTSGGSGTGIYIYVGSNSNMITDNLISTSVQGITVYISSNNTIIGGSIVSQGSAYSLNGAGITNNFTNTNFTGSRNIQFADSTSWFNYRNDSTQNIWLKTNVSTAGTITRTLVSWGNTTMQWNDTNQSSGIVAAYNITGLFANSMYTVTNSSGTGSTSQNLQTDANGNLPGFAVALNGNTEVKVQSPQILVILNSPVNNAYINSVTFNCSASSSNNLTNVTLYGNWSGSWAPNGTANISGTSNSTTFARPLQDGSYIWNCLAYDNSSNSTFAISNYTFTIDTAIPATITGLANQSQDVSWIYWNWANPVSDFSYANVYLNGIWKANTSNNFYNATVLSGDTWYEVAIRTVDNAGNINTTWVNSTAKTAYAPPAITSYAHNSTYGNATSPVVVVNASIKLNVTENQQMDQWNWTVDGVDQNWNYNNITLSFDGYQTRNVSVIGRKGAETTSMVTWMVRVLPVPVLINETVWLNHGGKAIYVDTGSFSVYGTANFAGVYTGLNNESHIKYLGNKDFVVLDYRLDSYYNGVFSITNDSVRTVYIADRSGVGVFREVNIQNISGVTIYGCWNVATMSENTTCSAINDKQASLQGYWLGYTGKTNGFYELRDSVIRNFGAFQFTPNIPIASSVKNLLFINTTDGLAVENITGTVFSNITTINMTGSNFACINCVNITVANFTSINSSGTAGTNFLFAGNNMNWNRTGGHDNRVSNVYIDSGDYNNPPADTGASGFDLTGLEYNFRGDNITVIGAHHRGFDLHSQYNVVLTDIVGSNAATETFAITTGIDYSGVDSTSGVQNQSCAVDVRAPTTCSHNISVFNYQSSNGRAAISVDTSVNVLFENVTSNNDSTVFNLFLASNITLLNISANGSGFGPGGVIGYIGSSPGTWGCNNCYLIDAVFVNTTSYIGISGATNARLVNVKRPSPEVFVSAGEFTNNHYADINVTDSNGNPISGVALIFSPNASILNQANTAMNGWAKDTTSFITESNGHTSLPNQNRSNSPAIGQYYKNYNGSYNTIGLSWNITAYDPTNIWTNITHIIYPNGTIQQLQPLAQATNIRPDSSWYRSNPNTYQNTTNLIINHTKTNLTITVTNTTNITVNEYSSSKINFTATNSTANQKMNITIRNSTFPIVNGQQYIITKNGVLQATQTASAGQINFTDISAGSEYIIQSTNGIVVSLVSPANALLTNNASVIFNCSAQSTGSLTNITLYANFSGTFTQNGTANVSGASNTTTFVRTLVDGSYAWNCLAYDNSGNYTFALSNSTLSMDTVKPVLANITASSITTSSATISWDTNELSNATLYYGTTTATTSNATNSTLATSHSFALSGLSASTPYYYNISSCDLAGNCNTSVQYSFTTSATPSQDTPSGCTGCGGGSGGSTVAQNKTNQTTGNMTTIVPATENTTNAIATQDPEIKIKAGEKISEIKAKITPSDINAKEKLGEAEAAYNAGDYTRAYSAAIEAEGLIGKGVTAKGGEMQNPRNPYFTYAVLAVVLTLAVYAFRKNLLFKPGKESAKEPQVPLKPQNAPLPKATIKKQPVNPASKDKGLDDIEKRLEEIKRKIGK